MKHLIILGKQYSRLLIRELVIMLMIVFILISLFGALSPLFYSITLNRYISSALPDNAIYFYPSTRILSSILTSDSLDTENEQKSLEAMIDGIADEFAVSGIGKTRAYGIGRDWSGTSRDTKYIGYNDDLIEFTSLPLAEGTWLDEHKEDEAVPVVVGGAFRDQDHMRVGDRLSIDFAADGAKTDCVVVGILNEDDMYLSISAGETNPSALSLARLYRWEQDDPEAFDCGIIIFPSSRVEDHLLGIISPGCLFFFDEKRDTSIQADMLSSLNQYGHSGALPAMLKTEYMRIVHVYNGDMVTSFSLFLFCILGLGGYTILMLEKNTRIMQVYRVCGMTKVYGTGLEILSIALPVILPACLTITQLKSRLESYLVLNSTVYLCFILILIMIMLPSVIYCIFADKRRSMMRRKE